MNASLAFRWLHAEEILLGRKQSKRGFPALRENPVNRWLRAAGIPIPQRIASGVAA